MSACFEDRSHKLPYNNVHTEGYIGNVKTVKIISYYKPNFNSDSTNVKNQQGDNITVQNFNKDGFMTSNRSYNIKDTGYCLLYRDSFFYNRGYKNFIIKKYNMLNKEYVNTNVIWDNDMKVTYTEQTDNSTYPTIIKEIELDNHYRYNEYKLKYYSSEGNLKIERVITYIRNKEGVLVKLIGRTLKSPNDIVRNNRNLVSTFKRKKNDTMGNPIFYISQHDFSDHKTIAYKLEYTYYD